MSNRIKLGASLVTGLLLFSTQGQSEDTAPAAGNSVYRLTQYSVVNVEMTSLSCEKNSDGRSVKTVALNIGFGRRSSNDVANTIYLTEKSESLENCNETPKSLTKLINAALLLDEIIQGDIEVEITQTNPPSKPASQKPQLPLRALTALKS